MIQSSLVWFGCVVFLVWLGERREKTFWNFATTCHMNIVAITAITAVSTKGKRE